MTEYSKMSYEALRKIADNDSVADNMSDEEYESLSIELWRKFSVENGIVEHYAVFGSSRPLTKRPVPHNLDGSGGKLSVLKVASE